jgi:hypothetical protein
MPLEQMYTALYRLFYKRDARDAFVGAQRAAPTAGLTETELAQLKQLDGMRLKTVVQLHAGDIGRQWYQPRVPASWLSLQVALEIDEPELVARFAESDAFELRIDDDADGRALATWVQQVGETGELEDAPWLPDLLRYELLLGARWTGDQNPRVEVFAWDVQGIRESLLEHEVFPTDEPSRKYGALFFRNAEGVAEAPLNREEARVMQAVLDGADTSREKTGLIKRCHTLLAEIRA